MSEMTRSGLAMVKVLESWGVDHLYGIPGGSINSTMDALYERRGSNAPAGGAGICAYQPHCRG